MIKDPLWKVVGKQASDYIKNYDFKGKDQAGRQRAQTSCQVTSHVLREIYTQKVNGKQQIIKEMSDANPIDYTKFFSSLNKQEKQKLKASYFISYRFSTPPDHWMTFIYDTEEKVWIILQSWQGVFSLGLWLRYPLLQIAKKVKQFMGGVEGSKGANPFQNLRDFCGAFCIQWAHFARKDPVLKELKLTTLPMIQKQIQLFDQHWKLDRTVTDAIIVVKK